MTKRIQFTVTVEYPSFWAPQVDPVKFTQEDLETAISRYQTNEDGRNGFVHATVTVQPTP